MTKTALSIKGAMDFDSVATFLADLVKSFKERTVCIQRGDEFVTLKPGDVMELELEAVVKKGKQKLSLEIAWKEEVHAEVEAPFKVSSKEPELPPAPVEGEEATTAAPVASVTPCSPALTASTAPVDVAKAPEKKEEPKTGAPKKQ